MTCSLLIYCWSIYPGRQILGTFLYQRSKYRRCYSLPIEAMWRVNLVDANITDFTWNWLNQYSCQTVYQFPLSMPFSRWYAPYCVWIRQSVYTLEWSEIVVQNWSELGLQKAPKIVYRKATLIVPNVYREQPESDPVIIMSTSHDTWPYTIKKTIPSCSLLYVFKKRSQENWSERYH